MGNSLNFHKEMYKIFLSRIDSCVADGSFYFDLCFFLSEYQVGRGNSTHSYKRVGHLMNVYVYFFCLKTSLGEYCDPHTASPVFLILVPLCAGFFM